MMPSITKAKRAALWTRLTKMLGVAAFWLAVWQTAYLYTGQELLLVSPAGAFSRLVELAGGISFWQTILASCGRILSGYLSAVAVGTLLAVLTSLSPLLHALFSPVLGIIRSTPVASFIILVLVWMSTNDIPGFMSFLMVAPMIWANVHTGIQNVDRKLLEMAVVYRIPRLRRVEAIYIPSVMPYFTAACSTSLGFAWKSGIAAEVIALPKAAIGKQIYNSKIYLETADLFAWTIAVIILSVIIERLAMLGLKKLEAIVVKGR